MSTCDSRWNWEELQVLRTSHSQVPRGQVERRQVSGSVTIHPLLHSFVRDAGEAGSRPFRYHSVLSSGQIKLVLGAKHPGFIV